MTRRDESQDSINELLAIEAFKSSGYLIVNKTLLKNLGLIPAVILSNYIDKYIYFKEKNQDKDGWFFLTHEHQMEQLGVSEHQIRQAKKELKSKSLIETKLKGSPAKEWYKINFDFLCRGLALENLEGLSSKNSRAYIYKENKYKENNIKLHSRRRNSKPPKEEKNLEYIPIAEKLSKIILTKKHIQHTPSQIKLWANELHQLNETNKVSIRRMNRALNYYEEHIHEKYTPVIESGRSFREKFIKLENAVRRNNHKFDEDKLTTHGSRMFDKEGIDYGEPDEVIVQTF